MLLRARGRVCECKITPKKLHQRKRVGWSERVGDGAGVPRRVFQKPVKVFPSANTKFVGPFIERGVLIHTHTHTSMHTHIHNTLR